MIIEWTLFAPALLLLLFPADRLLSARVVLRTFESFRTLENSPRHRPWWWVLALWLDPIRGLTGTLLLQSALDLTATEWALAPKPAYWLMLATLTVAVSSQIFTRREPQILLAPIGFVAGVVAALMPPAVTSIGLVTAMIGLFAFRRFHAFFTVGFAAIGLLGFVLHAEAAWIAAAVGALGLPIVAAVLTGSTLELPTHNAAGRLRRRGVSA